MSAKKTRKRAAPRRDDVVSYVQRTLAKNPSTSLTDVQAGAAKIDPAVGKLNVRSFNGRYVLAVRRALASKNGGGRRKSAVAKRTTAVRRSRTPLHVDATRNAVITMLMPLVMDAKKRTNNDFSVVYQELSHAADQIIEVARSR